MATRTAVIAISSPLMTSSRGGGSQGRLMTTPQIPSDLSSDQRYRGQHRHWACLNMQYKITAVPLLACWRSGRMGHLSAAGRVPGSRISLSKLSVASFEHVHGLSLDFHGGTQKKREKFNNALEFVGVRENQIDADLGVCGHGRQVRHIQGVQSLLEVPFKKALLADLMLLLRLT